MRRFILVLTISFLFLNCTKKQENRIDKEENYSTILLENDYVDKINGYSFSVKNKEWFKASSTKEEKYIKLTDSIAKLQGLSMEGSELLHLFSKDNRDELYNPFIVVYNIQGKFKNFSVFKEGFTVNEAVNIKNDKVISALKNFDATCNTTFIDEKNQIIEVVVNSDLLFLSNIYFFPKNRVIQFGYTQSKDGSWEEDYQLFKNDLIKTVKVIK